MSAVILETLARGTASAAELCAQTGLPQPTLSRRLAALRAQVLPMGAARARRYGLLRAIRDLPPEIPVYRVSEDGQARRIGMLSSLASGEFWFESSMGDKEATRLYADLPWWMNDLRPQGFLGRLMPRNFPELNLPPDVRLWDAVTVLYALARRGDDLMGDLMLGEGAYTRWWETHRESEAAWVTAVDTHRIYPQLAREVMRGPVPGSSPGGEQPKFLLRVMTERGVREMLVKFSPPVTQAIGQRWADLLRAEHHALHVLVQAGVAAVPSRIVQAEDRVFLEVERFDRVGQRGRRGMVSIGSADAEFSGTGATSWPQVARVLAKQRRLSPEDAGVIERITAYGHLIANTDMHPGNLGLYHDAPARPGYGQFTLAPVYDMLPMRYAPVAGEVLTPEFRPPAPVQGLIPAYSAMLEPAQEFWRRVAGDTDISPAFRELAQRNAEHVQDYATIL